MMDLQLVIKSDLICSDFAKLGLYFSINFSCPIGQSVGKCLYNITQSVYINGNTLSVGKFFSIELSVNKRLVHRYIFLPTGLKPSELV